MDEFTRPSSSGQPQEENGFTNEEVRADAARIYVERLTPAERGRLKTMPYEAFLETDYWRLYVRPCVRRLHQSKCSRCQKSHREQEMHVHHTSYEHRGMELLYLDDLEFLCRGCHKEEHGLGLSFGELINEL